MHRRERACNLQGLFQSLSFFRKVLREYEMFLLVKEEADGDDGSSESERQDQVL